MTRVVTLSTSRRSSTLVKDARRIVSWGRLPKFKKRRISVHTTAHFSQRRYTGVRRRGACGRFCPAMCATSNLTRSATCWTTLVGTRACNLLVASIAASLLIKEAIVIDIKNRAFVKAKPCKKTKVTSKIKASHFQPELFFFIHVLT